MKFQSLYTISNTVKNTKWDNCYSYPSRCTSESMGKNERKRVNSNKHNIGQTLTIQHNIPITATVITNQLNSISLKYVTIINDMYFINLITATHILMMAMVYKMQNYKIFMTR